MARPIKIGLDYFPMDTTWDIKMRLLKARYKQEVSLSNADGGPFGIYLLSREEAQARLDELRAKQDAE